MNNAESAESKEKSNSINFSRCLKKIKTGSKLRGGEGGVCISLVGKNPEISWLEID